MRKAGIIVVAVLLAACGGEEHEDLKKWMKDSTKDLKGQVPPLPEVKSFVTVAYDATSLLSPFDLKKIEPEKKPRSGSGLQPDLVRRREPLELYSLESIKMVGSLARGTNVVAVVRVDRAVHHVRVGNYIGQDFGLITNINESQITLKELVQDSGGDWVERVSTLQLQEK